MQPLPVVQASTLSTADWLAIAKQTLIAGGVEAVKIDRLARLAGVTRGGFYWRFKSRQDLLNQLIDDWRSTNTTPIMSLLKKAEPPEQRYRALLLLWIDENEFDPDYDTAMRNWARHSPVVADAVHEVDEIRMAAIRTLFIEAGDAEREASVRAQVTYFHQVGYYALGVKTSREQRIAVLDEYIRVLTGFEARP